jgi:hypothetical protein
VSVLLAMGVLVLALVVATVAAYQLGRIRGAEQVRTAVRSDEEARRLVEEVAGMTPAGRNERVRLLLNHKPPLIDKETARWMLELPRPPEPEPTRRQCRTCLLDVAACKCPMAARKGSA